MILSHKITNDSTPVENSTNDKHIDLLCLSALLRFWVKQSDYEVIAA